MKRLNNIINNFYIAITNKKSFFIALILACFQSVLELLGIISLATLLVTFASDGNLNNIQLIISLEKFFSLGLSTLSVVELQIVLVIFLIAKYVYQIVATYIIFYLMYKIRLDLSNKLVVNHFKSSSDSPLDEKSESSFIRNITYGVDHVADNGFIGLLNTLKDTLSLILILIYLIIFSWDDLNYFMLIILMLLPIGYLTSSYVKKLGSIIKDRTLDVMNHVQDISKLSYYYVISKKNDYFAEQFHKTRTKQVSPMIRYASITQSLQPIIELIIMIIILFFLVSSGLTGSSTSFESISLAIVAIIRLIPLTTRTLASMNSVYYSLPYLENLVTEIEKKPLNEVKMNIHKSKSKIDVDIEFLKIQDRTLLDTNSKITIEPNIITELRGNSGTGKTTILNLLGIQLLMQNIKVGYVEQFPSFFMGSIEQNIKLDDQCADSILIESLCNRVNLSNSFDKSVDKILSMTISDNGKSLSGGQRKKIALIRELYKNPEILLLDEPTAGIDHDGSIEISNIISRLKYDIPILITSHESIMKDMVDNVFYLENRCIKRI